MIPYRGCLTTFVKLLDTITGHLIGNSIRYLTNTNTKSYWNHRFLSNEWRGDFPYRYMVEFLPKDVSFSLLDIGCALGEGCLFLKKCFPLAHISGADFSPVAIEKAQKRTPDSTFFVLDIMKDVPQQKYDYITLVSTLEHFDDPFCIVDRCLPFVTQGLIIQCPFVEHFDNPRLYAPGLHRYLFNKDTFKGYNTRILKITERVEETGYQYILYEIRPTV